MSIRRSCAFIPCIRIAELGREKTIRTKLSDRTAVFGYNRRVSSKTVWAARRKAAKDNLIAELRGCGVRGKVNLRPKPIDVKNLGFDGVHINGERAHNITSEQAKGFIGSAKISVTAWNGRFEKYFATNGATYIDLQNNVIKTAYSIREFDDDVITMMEVLKQYGY